MQTSLKNIVEALLLSSHEPLSLEKIQAVFEQWEQPSLESLKETIQSLQADYASHSFELVEVASGFSMQTKSQYSPWLSRLHQDRPAKYSRALLETLAIIAYKQPVTRADIEDIRGVSVGSHIMKTLLEREWIKVAGHRDVPGKPAVYTTTKEFLNYFKLTHLNELPILQPLQECID